MALNQIQQVALELLSHKNITVKEAYALAFEFLNETGYLEKSEPLEVEVKFQAAMSDYEQWRVDATCKALDISVSVGIKDKKHKVLDIAKQRIETAIQDKLAQSSKKIGEIKYIDRDDIRQWINYPR